MADDDRPTCWICDSTDIAYTDVLDMAWCDLHFDEMYWA